MLLDHTLYILCKVGGVKVYPRPNQNNRAHSVTACISLWCHKPMHAPHRLIHVCTACFAPWCHRLMHAVTARGLLLWFGLRYTFISSYFGYCDLRFHRSQHPTKNCFFNEWECIFLNWRLLKAIKIFIITLFLFVFHLLCLSLQSYPLLTYFCTV